MAAAQALPFIFESGRVMSASGLGRITPTHPSWSGHLVHHESAEMYLKRFVRRVPIEVVEISDLDTVTDDLRTDAQVSTMDEPTMSEPTMDEPIMDEPTAAYGATVASEMSAVGEWEKAASRCTNILNTRCSHRFTMG